MKKQAGRRGFVPQYSKLDLMLSSATQPLAQPYRELLIGNMRRALQAIESGAAPTEEDWKVCTDAVNLVAVIIADGTAQDADGLLKDAENALAECGRRYKQGKPMRLSGAGLVAVRALLDDFETCVNSLSARYMKDVSNRADRIIWDAQRGRHRPGAEVIAI